MSLADAATICIRHRMHACHASAAPGSSMNQAITIPLTACQSFALELTQADARRDCTIQAHSSRLHGCGNRFANSG